MERIVIIGRPKSGKTDFALALLNRIVAQGNGVEWFSESSIREQVNDWDYASEGHVRIATAADLSMAQSSADFILCDIVAPNDKCREILRPDYLIWLDTNAVRHITDRTDFDPVNSCYLRLTDRNFDRWATAIAKWVTSKRKRA